MRVVKCYECGRRYNYDEDGFCPRCGAFNQPASLSRIGPDGSVIWIDGINSRNHEGSFVHKELHEENRERKGTALEQNEKRRKVITRSGPTVIRQPLAQRDGTPTIMPTRNGSSGKKNKSSFAVVILIIILLNFLSAIFSRLRF